MDHVLITRNFRIDVAGSERKPAETRHYTKGIVVAVADIPAGQSAEDWIAKGLAAAATPQTSAS